MENKKLTTGDKIIIGFGIAVGVAYGAIMIYSLFFRPDPFKKKEDEKK